MRSTTLSWLLGATAGVCGAAVVLNGPGSALATPARDFTTLSTRSFFQTIRVSGGEDAKGHAHHCATSTGKLGQRRKAARCVPLPAG